MTFEELERRYYELKGKHTAGLISDEEFLAEVDKLTLQDSEGRWWMIGARTGKCYVSQEGEWVEAERPRAERVCPQCGAPVEEGAILCGSCGYSLVAPPPYVSPPPARPKPAVTTAPPVAKRPQRGLLMGVIGVFFLCCLSGAALGTYEYLSPTRPISTRLVGLLRRPTSGLAPAAIPTTRPTPRATPPPTYPPMGTPTLTPTPTPTRTPTPAELIQATEAALAELSTFRTETTSVGDGDEGVWFREFIAPNRLRYLDENGLVTAISVGKDRWYWDDRSEEWMHQETVDWGVTLLLLPWSVFDLALEGREKVGGQPCQIVSYIMTRPFGDDYYDVNGRVWVGLQDYLPRKQEEEACTPEGYCWSDVTIYYDFNAQVEPIEPPE